VAARIVYWGEKSTTKTTGERREITLYTGPDRFIVEGKRERSTIWGPIRKRHEGGQSESGRTTTGATVAGEGLARGKKRVRPEEKVKIEDNQLPTRGRGMENKAGLCPKEKKNKEAFP